MFSQKILLTFASLSTYTFHLYRSVALDQFVQYYRQLISAAQSGARQYASNSYGSSYGNTWSQRDKGESMLYCTLSGSSSQLHHSPDYRQFNTDSTAAFPFFTPGRVANSGRKWLLVAVSDRAWEMTNAPSIQGVVFGELVGSHGPCEQSYLPPPFSYSSSHMSQYQAQLQIVDDTAARTIRERIEREEKEEERRVNFLPARRRKR